jgi:putative zinc ribbon protein
MPRKRAPLPRMACSRQAPEFVSTNERTGVSYYSYSCEGCGHEKTIPDSGDFDGSPPIFWSSKNGGCGCTARRELTDYHDPCHKCSGPIYLTPGGAMYRKYSGSTYQQRKKYCDDCLDEIVATGPCRNAGCRSIGGSGVVSATFRDQLFYAEKQFTFPPSNCSVCRKAKKEFERRQEVRPTCSLCKQSFRVTYGLMIMILKTEAPYEIPRECISCRGLSPDDRRRLARDGELDGMTRERINDLRRLFMGSKEELAKERIRLAQAQRDKRDELAKLLKRNARLQRVDLRARLHDAVKNGVLLEVLKQQGTPQYRVTMDMLAHVTGGRANMTEKEFAALPNAFRVILQDHPGASGLFQKASAFRAPGMSAVQQHYEVLSTAALKLNDAVARSQKSLRIYATDVVDFGIKVSRDFAQPKKGGTIEADVLIHRSRGILQPEKIIGLDAKYTQQSHYTHVPWDQLKGIRNNFGHHFEEFYFVTNREFSGDFRRAVEQTNRDLVRDYLEAHNEAKDDLPYLTAAERETRPDGKVDISELDKVITDQSGWTRIADNYNIPQIEMCEHVRYPGT